MTTPERKGRATLADVFFVARSRELTSDEKALWIVYRSYEEPGRGAYPGDELLSSHLGKSQRTVQRCRAKLVDKGWLKQTLRGPMPATYRAAIPAEGSPPVAKQSVATGGETRAEASPPMAKQGQASPKGSPSVSPPLSPEYGEYGETSDDDDRTAQDRGRSDRPVASDSPLCPECQAPMARRRSSHGVFWGCSRFSTTGCTGTLPIDAPYAPPDKRASGEDELPASGWGDDVLIRCLYCEEQIPAPEYAAHKVACQGPTEAAKMGAA